MNKIGIGIMLVLGVLLVRYTGIAQEQQATDNKDDIHINIDPDIGLRLTLHEMKAESYSVNVSIVNYGNKPFKVPNYLDFQYYGGTGALVEYILAMVKEPNTAHPYGRQYLGRLTHSNHSSSNYRPPRFGTIRKGEQQQFHRITVERHPKERQQ